MHFAYFFSKNNFYISYNCAENFRVYIKNWISPLFSPTKYHHINRKKFSQFWNVSHLKCSFVHFTLFRTISDCQEVVLRWIYLCTNEILCCASIRFAEQTNVFHYCLIIKSWHWHRVHCSAIGSRLPEVTFV